MAIIVHFSGAFMSRAIRTLSDLQEHKTSNSVREPVHLAELNVDGQMTNLDRHLTPDVPAETVQGHDVKCNMPS